MAQVKGNAVVVAAVLTVRIMVRTRATGWDDEAMKLNINAQCVC